MVRKHFEDIEVSKREIVAVSNYRNGDIDLDNYTDNDFISTERLTIVDDVPLPSYLKRVTVDVYSIGCNLIAFENLWDICDTEVAIGICVEPSDTVEQLQELIDLTINKYPIKHFYIYVNSFIDTNIDISGELNFNTQARVDIKLGGGNGNIVVTGKLNILNIEMSNVRISPNAEIGTILYNGRKLDFDIEEFYDYSLLPDLEESLVQRLQRLIGIDE